MTEFVSTAVDTLKTLEMKICIAHAFAKNGRFTIIRSDDRQALVDLGGPDTDGLGPDRIDGDEPEIPGENILVDDDRAFSAFEDADYEESNDSITGGCGDIAACNS